MSALTPITDIPPRGAEVRLVPKADISSAKISCPRCQCATVQMQLYEPEFFWFGFQPGVVL